ncbi:hypothetical protein LJ707_09315 [Mucilaginibacter sp. UR6-1]|uniref:hypothetical protein n=1 Tax=Mucilaginibacter sp. UR6-1 TaxID=1435643 RepID=UPI001E2E2915|nr:hypothetical protein [Mucilaginibacter sp. UR6-1]MCC8409129.1 hypothetical protein [Mucilaginibacter sp. UR6-1]
MMGNPVFTSDLLGVTNARDVKWVNDRLTAQAIKTFTQPLKLDHPFGNDKQLIYIACTRTELRAIKPCMVSDTDPYT